MAERDGPRPAPQRRLSRAALQALRKPLDPALVSERTDADGELVRYLEGWRVIEQANAIFGYGRWSAEVVGDVTYRTVPAPGRSCTATSGVYTATVRVSVEGCLPHTDVGIGVPDDHTPEAHGVAYKAAVTDGLKRALRHLLVSRNGVKSMSDRTSTWRPHTPSA